MNQYKILIIDDEPMVVKGLVQLVPWEEINCEIVGTAKNGEEGLEKVTELQPDIVISDIQMPRLSGLEMIKALNARKADAKFIILTGFRQFEYAKEAIDLGVAKFLLKPTNLEDIKAAVVDVTTQLDEERFREQDLELLRQKLKETMSLIGAEGDVLMPEMTEGNEKVTTSPHGDKNDEEKMKYLAASAIAYIKANYKNKLDLQTIADHLYISTWYLCKLFKKEVGSNFVDLLNEIRIQAAKQLLTESNLKVYEICEQVGYTDNAYFTKIFKKYAGMTPNTYRNTLYK